MSTYIVIGAGILGASTAYHLAKSGADVTVVDKKHDGQATDAAAGIVCPWLSQRRNKAWYRLAKYGAKYYQDLIASLEADGETNTGYKKVGAISIHTDENKLDKMQERAYKRREDAPEIGDISRLLEDKTQRGFPFYKMAFNLFTLAELLALMEEHCVKLCLQGPKNMEQNSFMMKLNFYIKVKK